MHKISSIDQYINNYSREIQTSLKQIQQFIRELAPNAEETIKYGIPTFTLNGRNLVHFAAYKNHIGFYPTSSGIKAFEKELQPYISGKGTLRFSLDKPIPINLLKKVVQYRVEETQLTR